MRPDTGPTCGDDPEGPQPAQLPVFAEAIAAARADEVDVLREIAHIATEPRWPEIDSK